MNKLTCRAALIFGDPAETLATANETLGWWRQHGDGRIWLGTIVPAPDCADYRLCLERGIIKDKVKFLTEDLFVPVNMTSMPYRDWCRMMLRVYLTALKHTPKAVPYWHDGGIVFWCPYCRKGVEMQNYDLPSTALWLRLAFCRHCRKQLWLVSRWFKRLSVLCPSCLPWWTYPLYRWLKKRL